MRLSSPAFQDQSFIPTKYAHQRVVGGKNISIPLMWSDVPAGTRSLALSIIDPHPVAKHWVHWIAIDIPPNILSLAEGASGTAMPAGSKEFYNSYGELGYGGPEPPKGSGRHPYVITLFALSTDSLPLSQNASRTAFEEGVKEVVLASATLTGFYER